MSDLSNPKEDRLSWDETFMNLAFLIAKRTSCKFHEAGVVFVDDNKRIISLGYNGPTAGDPHCIEVGCAKVDGDPKTGQLKRCRGAHAEINGIINAQDPRRLQGATAYTLLFPCYDCMKAFNNAGINEIVYFKEYQRIITGGEKHEEEDEAKELAKNRGIRLKKYDGQLMQLNGTESKTPNQTQKICVSGFVVNNNKVLLLRRSSRETFLPGYYELPGSKVNFGEAPERALLREIKEETGLEVEIIKPYSTFAYNSENNQRHTTDIQYLAKLKADSPTITLSEAHDNYIWISPEAINQYQITDDMKVAILKGFDTAKEQFQEQPNPAII